MDNNVSTNALSGLAGEIQASVNQLKQELASIKEATATIKTQCETLNSYHNQRVAGSYYVTKEKEKRGKNPETSRTIQHYEIWQITGQTEISEKCHSVESELSVLEDTLTQLTSEATNIELVSEVIENYIQSIQTELGENVDASILSSTFATLGTSIAYSAGDASAGNYISRDRIIDEYWTSSALRFERQENGSYLIYKKDENGNEVAMGYTSALTATMYLTQMKKSVNVNSKEKSNNQTTTTENAKQETIAPSDTKYVTENQISDNVKKEIGNYAKVDISESNADIQRKEAYNNLSQEAKNIIDGKTQILYANKDMGTIIDHRADIVVPKGKHLYVDGTRIIGTDMVFHYDNTTSTYRLVNSDGGYAVGKGYSCQEMFKSEIK